MGASKNLFDTFAVTLFCRSNEVIIRDIQTLPKISKTGNDSVRKFQRCDPRFTGGFLSFLTMFIGSRQKIDIVAKEPVISRNHITQNRRENVTDVG
jgi:hypothetical protein